jgi:hypothetical protein
MLKREEIATLIKACKLQAFQDEILAHVKPAILLRLEHPSAGRIGESRVGGVPDLPPSTPWPRDTAGRAHRFLLQIKLADVPVFEGNVFPARGMLYVFVGLDEPATDVAHTIVLYTGDEALAAAAPPLECEYANEGFSGIPPYTIGFKLAPDVPHWATNAHAQLLTVIEQDLEGAFERFEQLEHKLRGEEEGAEYFGQLLGHVRCIGHDSREDAFVVHEINPDWLYKYDRRAKLDMNRAEQWQNLLCFESNQKLHLTIWDAGHLNFLIHEDDLHKLEFSRVYAAAETS